MDLLADNFWIGAQALPKLVDQDHDAIPACHSFIGEKVAPVQKPDAHHLVEARRGELALDILRLILGGQIETAAGECIQILKGLALVLPVNEVLRRNAVVKTLNLGPDHDQLVGLGIGHGREQRGVNRREDSGVGADA